MTLSVVDSLVIVIFLVDTSLFYMYLWPPHWYRA